MGKINGCLKCLFIFFNVVFMLFGSLLIYSAVVATAVKSSAFGGPGVGWTWVTAIGVFGISFLGIYAACSEKLLALKIFAGFMGVGMIIMLIFGIILAVLRNKMKEEFLLPSDEFVKQHMEEEVFRNEIEAMQTILQCCGFSRAQDWGNTIPESCRCTPPDSCKPRPMESSGPSMIYSQPCSQAMFGLFDLGFKVAMGIYFGFSVTALLGLLISLFMIRQVSRHDGAGGPSMTMKGY
ncbi:tetraspanin-8-like [Kryptolebias marmoratus]|uniref:Tetraspanin n=1 Tax=Kryptolebias marmoratus TaxID=37003 RepID=A0A3Q2ZUA9_KRYMA|nr:tetraspanin-8-like [Kryptolebias marmoratus]